ncbi:MAG: glucoamylase family protein [Ramlibacter sp.]
MSAAAVRKLKALSAYARHYLTQQAQHAEPPIRAELFGLQRFEQHGRSLAQAQEVAGDGKGPRGPSFFPRVEDNIRALRRAYDYVALQSQSGHYVTPAAEWLLDNFHLVEAQLQQIREGVPRRYYAELPKLSVPHLFGLPRVYGIAWAYVAHTDSVLNPEILTAFLNAYQDVSELRLSELWALPTTLRVVLLENLRRVADSIAFSKVARETAHAAWDEADTLTPADLDALLELMRARGLERSFLTQLWQRLPAEKIDGSPPLVAWVEAHCTDGHSLMTESQVSQVESNLTVSNVITTMRLIGQVKWLDLIQPLSRPLKLLGELPSFTRESELTRKQITYSMERMARRSGRTEHEVAEAVVRAAWKAPGTDAAQQTAGWHLFGPGQSALAAELGIPVRTGARARRSWRLGAYMGAIAAGTAALLLGSAYHSTWWSWPTWVALALLLLPASEGAASFLHRLLSESLKIDVLPRLDFPGGIPPEHRVLVVIPAILSSPASIHGLTERLRLHWLANSESQAQFALLSDWPDAREASCPADNALLAEANERIAELNQSYPAADGAPPRFLLLHRPRTWCETQQCWLGWERKRGKLEMLVRLLATGDATGFLPMAPGLALAPDIKYIVTLDSDTGLPPGALRELVSVAAHPLIAPSVDKAARRVTGGYGILQPRVVAPIPRSEDRTRYHQLFAGRCGIDPYGSLSSDVYQDMFGRGSFTGKGLLNVQAVHEVLAARLPDGAVLSHDLLEGTIARCGYVSDIALVEDHPCHTAVADSRVHRWTRGDWQLLPLMLDARRHGIDALGLWKMGDNLRRSLVIPASFLLIAWVLFTGALPLVTALAVVGAALLAGPLMGAVAGLVPTRRGIALKHFYTTGIAELGKVLAAAGWQFTQLAATARMFADAAVRAAWRMAASRRKLLEWTTAEQAQAQASGKLPAFLRQYAGVSVACLALAFAARWSVHPVAGPLIFLLWALAPVAAWWASRAPSVKLPLNEAEQDYLQHLARDTWRFFERCVDEQDNHLPPDNLQMVPEATIAHRTSPTNIGLYLLAVCCAREFGWIGAWEVVTRLKATLDSMDKLARFHGHLYNWYDTQSLAVLQPGYVSTVDSGNLACLLLTVGRACRALAADQVDETLRIELLALAERAQAQCDAMDFRPLYNSRRHLFHIGLRVEEAELDAGYYDLLASEARLTSFLAIGTGQVPRRHWQALGRPFLTVGGKPGLKSWSGSMFEYLMPSLLMPEPPQGLLNVAAESAVREQQAFGRAQGLPWGVSESAYFAQDHTLAYQYGPFGVPRLALRRTPPAERVVAPYATLMAAMFAPLEAVENLRMLERMGGRGEYGMYESLDFSVSRQPRTQTHSVVETYMAHHHGMSIASLCNLLCAQGPRRWFASAPLVQAHEALLQEAAPRQVVRTPDPRPPPEPAHGDPAPAFQSRELLPLVPGWQPTQLLSNGRYSVALRANGAGMSRWQGKAVSRWRDDLLRDQYGTFFYLRREGEDDCVSLTANPMPGPRWRYATRFMADRVQFDAHGEDLTTTITVLVSPEDDTELRMVTLHNTGDTELRCELVSYFESVLAPARADEAHPAFSGLFVQADWQPDWRALTLWRTPRLEGDSVMAVAHMLASATEDVVGVGCIADRRAFLGRNRGVMAPCFPMRPHVAPGPVATGLDPVAALRVELRIAPGATAKLCFATLAAPDVDNLPGRIDQYLQPMQLQRAMRMAATLAQVRLRDLGLSPEDNAALQDLTTALMYSSPRLSAELHALDQRQLWRLSISGDKPIVLVRIHSSNGMRLLGSLMRAHPWWTFGGLAVDIVVLNGEPQAYQMPLQRDILALRDRLLQAAAQSFGAQEMGGFFLLREQELSPGERSTLSGLARAVFNADGRALDVQVDQLREAWAKARAGGSAARRIERLSVDPALAPRAGAAALLPALAGEFDPGTGEFCFEVQPGQTTPRPWVNVISNPRFGFQVSETGSGFTWAINSRLHQVTPWSNDVVRDPPGEHWLLQDLDSRRMHPLAPGAQSPARMQHTVRHGQGYSVIVAQGAGLHTETTFFASIDEPVKVVHVRVRNTGSSRRRLRALGIVEWQLGDGYAQRRTVRTWLGEPGGVLFAQQREHRAGFGGATAFLTLAGGRAASQWTCDRSEFFDTTGRMGLPALMAGRTGTVDPVAALATDFEVAAGEEASYAFVLGHSDNAAQARELAAQWGQGGVDAELKKVKGWWQGLLGQVQVRTPDPAFDMLVNRWLLYQTVSCRLWAKAGFYQAGGAFGYRDQLQDAMALALADPARLREQILVNASRQFPEGDVQHWWHAPGGEGVRTHFSDDLLWLPYAIAYYVEVTGDVLVLDEDVEFINGPQIPEGAEDAYYTPHPAGQRASVYEHAARTIDRSLKTGKHGLPLMGTGDWNDGMNRVGHEGKGESVWLAWFLCTVVERFAPIARNRGEHERAQRWGDARAGWIAALHSEGWDGAWFRRAFFDNGDPLGSAANPECRIDLIAQAWSVLSGASTAAFTQPALYEMERQLVDRQAGLLRLLHPPLKDSQNNPGYIQAYPRGVRENGGQYSHGAVWAMMAQALTGNTDGAWESFQALSPAHRSADRKRAAAYELEPYVMAGDVYTAAPYVGRGGWSWYTGSAAWLYRAAIETLLGLAVRPGRIALSPRLPSHWPSVKLRLKLQGRDITVHWQRSEEAPPRIEAHATPGWGEWVALEGLPAEAVLLVRGVGPGVAQEQSGGEAGQGGFESVTYPAK